MFERIPEQYAVWCNEMFDQKKIMWTGRELADVLTGIILGETP